MVKFATVRSSTETVAQWAKIKNESQNVYERIWDGVPQIPDREEE